MSIEVLLALGGGVVAAVGVLIFVVIRRHKESEPPHFR
jgi:hypothetical protein